MDGSLQAERLCTVVSTIFNKLAGSTKIVTLEKLRKVTDKPLRRINTLAESMSHLTTAPYSLDIPDDLNRLLFNITLSRT